MSVAGRYFQPFSSDMVMLQNPAGAAAWDALTEPRFQQSFTGPFAANEAEASLAQRAAISGAASKFLRLFFCNSRALQPLWCAAADQVLATTMAFVGSSDNASYPVPFKQGEDIAEMVRAAVLSYRATPSANPSSDSRALVRSRQHVNPTTTAADSSISCSMLAS
jgi:hypothetical protein